MSGSTLVDTDVLVDFMRDVPDAVDRLRAESSAVALAVSVVTHLELLAGLRDKSERRKLARLLKRFTVVKLNPPICDRAVAQLERHRLSHGLLMADGLIAATALASGYPLLTKNWKHYQFIRGLVIPPYA